MVNDILRKRYPVAAKLSENILLCENSLLNVAELVRHHISLQLEASLLGGSTVRVQTPRIFLMCKNIENWKTIPPIN